MRLFSGEATKKSGCNDARLRNMTDQEVLTTVEDKGGECAPWIIELIFRFGRLVDMMELEQKEDSRKQPERKPYDTD